MKLYEVIDLARDKFYVLGTNRADAQTKYETWRDTPDNIENPEGRDVVSVVLIASDGSVDESPDDASDINSFPTFIE
jgi:hypothetical protein